MARGEILDDIDYDDLTDGARPGTPEDHNPNNSVDQLDIQSRPVSALTDREKFLVLQGWIYSDTDASSAWRQQSTLDFGFVAGEQLTDEDKAILDSGQRPHIVFNRTLTILKAVAGMEINGRHEIQFLPRTIDDSAISEIMSGASKWMADGCDAEDEESHAFQDTTKVGMGWTESRFSYDEDSMGAYVEERIDPREMVWDRACVRKNLKGARRIARIRRMPLSDAMQMFRGKSKRQLDAQWADLGWQSGSDGPRSIEEKRIRDGSNSYEDWDDTNEVTLVHIQWWEREPYYLAVDNRTGDRMEMSIDEYRVLSRRMKVLGMDMDAVRLTRKVYYQAFLGNELLAPISHAPCGNRFSWACITGEFDEKKRQWYGLVRVVRDPQMWANKFMSQIMAIMNSTAKGGIISELDAFDDQRQAEESYAQADEITWAAKGALSGPKPKIMPKPGQGDPSAYVGLLQFAVTSIKDVTGINLELLGQQDQNQPGILEHMRKQAGMTVLATLFDSLRRYRKFIGRIRLHYIQTKMSDGRLIRVVGEEYQGLVPLVKEYTTGEYDVVVDDAPTSPNQKEANWAIIQPMLAVFKDQLMAQPEVLAMVLEYSPLPSRLVAAIKRTITQAAENPEQAAMQQALMRGTVEKLMSEVEKNKSQAVLNAANAQKSGATAAYDMAVAENMRHDNMLQRMDRLLQIHKSRQDGENAVRNAVLTEAKAMRERVGARLDVARAHSDIMNSRTDRMLAVGKLRLDTAAARSGMVADQAKAFKDRVEGMKRAREPDRPSTPAGGQ